MASTDYKFQAFKLKISNVFTLEIAKTKIQKQIYDKKECHHLDDDL